MCMLFRQVYYSKGLDFESEKLQTGAQLADKSRVGHGVMGRCAHPLLEDNVLISAGGTDVVMETRNAYVTKAAGNHFSVLNKLRELTKKSKKEILSTISKLKDLNPDPAVAHTPLVAAAILVCPDTMKAYWKQLRDFKAFLDKNQKQASNWDTFYGILASRSCEAILENYLHFLIKEQKCKKSGLLKARSATNWARRVLNVQEFLKKGRSSSFIHKLASRYLNKPEPTSAIPFKILLVLFKWLEREDPFAHKIIFLAYNCASRASEINKLKLENIHFGEKTWESHPYVTIKFMRTKTTKEYVDDYHLITIYKNPVKGQYCLFTIVKELVKIAEERKHPFLVSQFSKKNTDTRMAQWYLWFDGIKTNFSVYLKEVVGWDFDVSKIRFHSFRTTYIGLMALWGMSWDKIKLRTGHKFDSETARNTYFANSLLTHGFDRSFETVLNNNPAAAALFSKKTFLKQLPKLPLKRARNETTIPKKRQKLSSPVCSQEENEVLSQLNKQLSIPFLEVPEIEPPPKNKRDTVPISPLYSPVSEEDSSTASTIFQTPDPKPGLETTSTPKNPFTPIKNVSPNIKETQGNGSSNPTSPAPTNYDHLFSAFISELENRKLIHGSVQDKTPTPPQEQNLTISLNTDTITRKKKKKKKKKEKAKRSKSKKKKKKKKKLEWE